MIKLYTIITCFVNSIAVFGIILQIIAGFFFSSETEDYFILMLILVVLYTSFSVCTMAKPFFNKRRGQYQIIEKEEIQNMIRKGNTSKILLLSNFVLGALISFLMIVYSLQESLADIFSEPARYISVSVIIVYGLIQMHFSFLIKQKLKLNFN